MRILIAVLIMMATLPSHAQTETPTPTPEPTNTAIWSTPTPRPTPDREEMGVIIPEPPFDAQFAEDAAVDMVGMYQYANQSGVITTVKLWVLFIALVWGIVRIRNAVMNI